MTNLKSHGTSITCIQQREHEPWICLRLPLADKEEQTSVFGLSLVSGADVEEQTSPLCLPLVSGAGTEEQTSPLPKNQEKNELSIS